MPSSGCDARLPTTSYGTQRPRPDPCPTIGRSRRPAIGAIQPMRAPSHPKGRNEAEEARSAVIRCEQRLPNLHEILKTPLTYVSSTTCLPTDHARRKGSERPDGQGESYPFSCFAHSLGWYNRCAFRVVGMKTFWNKDHPATKVFCWVLPELRQFRRVLSELLRNRAQLCYVHSQCLSKTSFNDCCLVCHFDLLSRSWPA